MSVGGGDPEDILTLTVDAAAAGARLDRFLADGIPGLSRSRLAFLIKAGHVSRAGEAVTDPAAKVQEGARFVVAIPPPRLPLPEPEAIPLSIPYEDDSLLVVDKPAGMVVHPAQGNWTGTLVNALLHHCGPRLSGIGGVRRPGIVHRLDKDTSGLMVVAKTDRAHHSLSQQLADRSLSRIYTAIAWGLPGAMAGEVDAPIGRHPTDRKKMAVVSGGKPAQTAWRVEAALGTKSRSGGARRPAAVRLSCRLRTGRTHQIRIHMAHIGHPLIGDPLYGPLRNPLRRKDLEDLPEPARMAIANFQRQALHAGEIAFRHPETAEDMRFCAQIPKELKALIAALE